MHIDTIWKCCFLGFFLSPFQKPDGKVSQRLWTDAQWKWSSPEDSLSAVIQLCTTFWASPLNAFSPPHIRFEESLQRWIGVLDGTDCHAWSKESVVNHVLWVNQEHLLLGTFIISHHSSSLKTVHRPLLMRTPNPEPQKPCKRIIEDETTRRDETQRWYRVQWLP